MNKGIVLVAFFVALTFVSCQSRQSNIEKQDTNSTPASSTIEDVSATSEVEKEITYFPAIERYLIKECGSKYLEGQYCIPFQTVVAVDERNDEDILVLVTVTVPHDLEKMTVNLMGPFIINVKDMKGAQCIVDNDDYPVKFPIYDILQKNKEG